MPATLSLQLSDFLRATCPNLRLGGVIGSVSRNGTANAQLTDALDALTATLRDDPAPMAHPRLVAMEETFRRAGANPKRYAPASTALMKRIEMGRDLYRINDLVDTNNLLSLTLRLPCGIYDRDHLAGTRLTFDLGAPQATYLGIDQVEQRTQGKLLLTDRDKVVGGPHADAYPTRITSDTRHFLCVLYLPDSPESPVGVDELVGEASKLFVKMLDAVVLGTLMAD